MKLAALGCLALVGAVAVVNTGCGSEGGDAKPAFTPARRSPLATAAPTATLPKNGEQVAVLMTNKGRIVFKFMPDKAPKTVENFIKLANEKFYDGTKFHRVVPRYLIQGGDPTTKGDDRSKYGSGGPGYYIKGEMNDAGHKIGSVAMAREVDRDSAGSQFYIMVADHPELDPDPSIKRAGYTVFGQVIEGMNVVKKIVDLPKDSRDIPNPENPAIVNSITIQTWPLKE